MPPAEKRDLLLKAGRVAMNVLVQADPRAHRISRRRGLDAADGQLVEVPPRGATEPLTSMPRQASSTTATSKPSRRASSAE